MDSSCTVNQMIQKKNNNGYETMKHAVRKARWFVLVFISAGILYTGTGNTAEKGIEPPVEMLKRTSDQVIKILVDEREQLQQNPDRIYQIVDEYILPYIDDVSMAKLALGKNWRKASREQKLAFVDEFRNLLVRTYSKSLLEFRDQKINFFPVNVDKDTKKISVKAEVIQPGGPPVPLAYRMRIKNDAWKVYDIKVDGISLVTSYRGTFTQEVRKSGIDGLLKYLRDKNHQVSDKNSSQISKVQNG